VIFLTIFYGLRRSEVLGLRWSAIDFEENTIVINHAIVIVNKNTYHKDSMKNNESESILPLPDIVKKRLQKWKAKQDELKHLQPNDYIHNDYVCTMINGEVMKPTYISQHFKRMLLKFGMPHIRFHDLRHSSANYLKFLGFDLKDIQVWLRHADIQTTMDLYVHLDMKSKSNIGNRLEAKFTKII